MVDLSNTLGELSDNGVLGLHAEPISRVRLSVCTLHIATLLISNKLTCSLGRYRTANGC